MKPTVSTILLAVVAALGALELVPGLARSVHDDVEDR
jgi:hypothetical protein